MEKTRVFLILGMLFALLITKAQSIQQVVDKLDNYSMVNPQEKLYLQLDKNSYSAGESIWFKAYATIGINNLFSNFSGIAYVDLIDVSGIKVDSLIIPLVMGVGLGDFVLSDTLTEGSYRLRAYTQWMRNSDDAYYYDRTLQIYNGRSDNVATKTSVKPGRNNSNYSIELHTVSGDPITNTKVSYEVLHKGKVVERKRITSDDNGRVSIDLDSKYQEGVINLKFANTDKRTIKKMVKIVDPSLIGHVELFPEGGKLLAGFLNTVGVKSVAANGLGEQVEVLFTNGKDTLGRCMTNELGMGACALYLNGSDSLHAYYISKDGLRVDIDVPNVHHSGYSLQVNNQNTNKAFVQLNTSSDLINGEEIYFVVHHLGKVFFVSKQKLNKDELFFSLKKEGLPSGVITITLLNSQFRPLVERPIFSYNTSHLLDLSISSDKRIYSHREKVNVNLKVLGSDTMKVAALSAAVLNISKVKDISALAPNILSGLLLSGDVKGYIENPGYYFEGNELKVVDMDYLMLTQGWRSIDWAGLDLSIPHKYSVEKALSISGYTKKLGRSKPEGGAKIQMISTQNYMDFIDTTANEDGFFVFDNLLFPDSVKYLITAKDAVKGKSNIDIIYNKPIRASIGVNRNQPEEQWDVNSMYADEVKHIRQYFEELERAGLKEKVIQIEEVVVRARQEPKASKNSSNLNGPGRADQIITAEDLSTCASLEMCLAGRLMGVTWQAGVPYNTRGNVPMQVVLDGMFIEPDQISSINVSDVESVEVLRSINYTSIYGSNGGGGLLVITSKTGDALTRNYTPKGIITIQPRGIHINRQFYKPKYEVASRVGNMKDLRTLIHWEPALVTGVSGEARFDFYTADEQGEYLITIEGLDLYGRICHVLYIIEVQ